MNNLNYSKRPVSLLIINKRRVVVVPSKTNKKIVKKNSTSFHHSTSIIENKESKMASPQFKNLLNTIEQKTQKEIIKLEFPKIKNFEPVIDNQNSKHTFTSHCRIETISSQLTKTITNESKLDNYIIGKEIGRGAFAKVKLCQHRLTGEKYAMKIYDRLHLLDKSKRSSALKEIEILKRLSHPNIVKFNEFIEEHQNFYLIMEEAKGISLLSYIKSLPNRKMMESNVRKIFKQIMEALAYMHSKNIYHRDIKMENIILDNQFRVKIIDFGFGVHSSNDTKLSLLCGTPSYMSPEMILKKDYFGSAVDIWSVGIVLYVLLCGTFPFKGKNERELFTKIPKGIFTIPEGISSNAKLIIRSLLVVNPNERATAEFILKHEWVSPMLLINDKNKE